MHRIVDKISDQHLLNTSAWKWIIPRLYRQYPDDDIVLNISASSPPFLRLRDQDIAASLYVDMIIDVVDNGEVIPVACISLVSSFEVFACENLERLITNFDNNLVIAFEQSLI